MLIKNYNFFFLLFLFSVGSVRADFFEDYLNNFLCGFARRLGDNSGQYLWDNYKREIIIGTILLGTYYVVQKNYRKHKKEPRHYSFGS